MMAYWWPFHEHEWARSVRKFNRVEERPFAHRIAVIRVDRCVDCGKEQEWVAEFPSQERSAWHTGDAPCRACAAWVERAAVTR